MNKSALRAVLAVLCAAPVSAAIPTAPTPTQENLEQFADLSQTARTAARLENANQNLSRGYDASAAAPSVAAAADTPSNSGLEPAPPEQGIHYSSPPDVTPDKAPADTAAEDAKKKKNLQRAMIGGAGGAAVLAVFGFIFGGPVGALLGAGIGFALLAGVTHLNNNPIDG
ncbi:hypothetical protein EPO15_05480 [bacterium]|nr:MAG: hypothetical protein EPO15_05480 [bacterium]